MTERGVPERQKRARMWSRGGGRGEQSMVPRATFASYYGRPVLKKPVWSERDVAGYLFSGGIAAGSAAIAAGADLTGRPGLRRTARLSTLAALAVSGAALVHDLGKPSRFYNMLRVLKPTSPMSVGSWLLSAFAAPAGLAAAAELPAVLPRPVRPVVTAAARPAGITAAALGAGVATYTAVLLADTAVPSWNAAYPELPFVFAASALEGASGLGLIFAPIEETAPLRRLAVVAGLAEIAAAERVKHRLGLLARPYKEGKAGRRLRLSEAMTVAGIAIAAGGRRRRLPAVAGGTLLVGASALSRFGIFAAGVASTEDPQYVVTPQRERLESGAVDRPG